jgi:hypothetical protein
MYSAAYAPTSRVAAFANHGTKGSAPAVSPQERLRGESAASVPRLPPRSRFAAPLGGSSNDLGDPQPSGGPAEDLSVELRGFNVALASRLNLHEGHHRRSVNPYPPGDIAGESCRRTNRLHGTREPDIPARRSRMAPGRFFDGPRADSAPRTGDCEQVCGRQAGSTTHRMRFRICFRFRAIARARSGLRTRYR